MPIAYINIAAGRSPEKIERMAQAVTQALAESLDAPIESIRVLVNEVDPTLWFAGGASLASRGR